MFFWIFMLIVNMLIPAMMFGFGKFFRDNPPEEINYAFGYRTTRSMKNNETWLFAQKKMGKIWFEWSKYLALFTVVSMVLMFGKSKEMIGNRSLWIMGVNLAGLLVPIYFVEKLLKENFDENGNKK